MAIATKRRLITTSWTPDVDELETALGRFTSSGRPAKGCEVVFFEIPGDRHLHVNVTHDRETTTPHGWAGPASTPDGFVHNRLFGDMQRAELLRHIREMVFAPGTSA